MKTSLHGRLLLLLLLFLAICWLGLWVSIQREAVATATADLDRRLSHAAATLLAGWRQSRQYLQAATKQLEEDQSPTVTRGGAERQPNAPVEFELANAANNRVLARSAAFPNRGKHAIPAPAGFSTQHIAGRKWRVLTVVDRQNNLVARVALPYLQRRQRSAYLTAQFLRPVLFVLPILGLLAWLSTWYGLKPLRRLTNEIRRRDATDLAPLATGQDRAPDDVRTLMDALDRLFGRLRDAFTAQRTFTAAAGHELRTPIAGMQAQLQVARRAPPGEQREQALSRLEQATDHMSRLVRNLLMLARLDPAARNIDTYPLDLADLIRQVAATRQSEHATPSIHLAIDAGLPAVDGDADLLDTLVGNLLDNALRHEPADGEVTVSLTQQESWLALTVSDNGPGVPASEREPIFESFYCGRGENSSHTGLGLAIVQTVADAHGGDIRLETSATGGARFVVRLPPAS